jgi:hypothetical protein
VSKFCSAEWLFRLGHCSTDAFFAAFNAAFADATANLHILQTLRMLSFVCRRGKTLDLNQKVNGSSSARYRRVGTCTCACTCTTFAFASGRFFLLQVFVLCSGQRSPSES